MDVFEVILHHTRVKRRKSKSLAGCLSDGGIDEPGGTSDDAPNDDATRPEHLYLDSPADYIDLLCVRTVQR